MAEPSQASSSSSGHSKPVVVRVKRKSNQERVEAFWLEINERPAKRKLLDIEALSVSDSPEKAIMEVKTKKLLVEHVETISSSEAAKDVLQSYLPNFRVSKDLKKKFEERKDMFKQDKACRMNLLHCSGRITLLCIFHRQIWFQHIDARLSVLFVMAINKQEQLRSIARQKHEDLVRNARFEQIWKSRKEKIKAGDDSLNEICHLYDVVQVDNEDENSRKVQKQERVSPEDNAILCNYLPLLREYIASAAEEIESEMRSYAFGEESTDDGTNGGQSARADYVYDLYTVKDNTNGIGDEATTTTTTYPLVQVNHEDDFYDGPSDSDYATDDSNAENNPLHDYPDEVSSEEEKDEFDFADDNSLYEDEVVNVSEEDEEDWKWRQRSYV